MGKMDPKVDAYIGKAKPFAQPILEHLRELGADAVIMGEREIAHGIIALIGSACEEPAVSA